MSASIDVAQQPTDPTPGVGEEPGALTAAPWRCGWAALVITLLARTAMTILASLLVVSLVPGLFGWHSTVVLSGSMSPALHVGDVVAARPVPRDRLKPGQVLLFDDPDHPGRLRTHRLVRISADGRLVTRGDANRANDSTPVTVRAVHGVGALRVPLIGLPRLLLDERRWRELLALLVATLALGAACWIYAAEDADRLEASP